MQINITENDTSKTIALQGCLDTGAAAEFSEAINKVIEDNPYGKLLEIDFKEVDFIASSGLRVMVIAAKKEAAAKRKIKLYGMNEVIKEVVEVTGLQNIFEIKA